MRLDSKYLQLLAEERGLSLNELLRRAEVSKTAYYHLARKDTILPGSVERIARELGVAPSAFIEVEDAELFSLRKRRERLEELMQSAPETSRENIWHTLTLQELNPLERLNRSLRRGRGAAFFKERTQVS